MRALWSTLVVVALLVCTTQITSASAAGRAATEMSAARPGHSVLARRSDLAPPIVALHAPPAARHDRVATAIAGTTPTARPAPAAEPRTAIVPRGPPR
jgi:hypothetical protein